MNCRIHFYLLNDHFSEEYAKEHNNGEESELNRKYQWEDELEITTAVSSVNVHDGATYPMRGTMPDGTEFQHDIPNMHLFELVSDTGSTYVGCSSLLLDRFDIDETDGIVMKVFLKGEEPLSNPIPGIYIAAQEFPKELIG